MSQRQERGEGASSAARSTPSAPSCRPSTPARWRHTSTPRSSACATRCRWSRPTRPPSWPRWPSPTSCSRPAGATAQIADRLTAMADEFARLLPPVQARQPGGRLLAENRRCPRTSLLPALVGRGGRPDRRAGRHRRQHPPPAQLGAPGILGRRARRGRAAPRATRCAKARRRKPEVLVAAKMEALKLREDLDREVAAPARGVGAARAPGRRARPARRSGSSRSSRRATARSAKREEGLAGREQALRAREGEADRLAQEQRVKLERIAGLTAEDARREILQRVEDEARGQAAGAGARHQGAGQARRRPRGAAHHLDGHPAAGRRAHRREHRGRGGAPQRRDEGPHHRPRGPEHPRLRDRHRRRRHHRRHAGHGRA